MLRGTGMKSWFSTRQGYMEPKKAEGISIWPPQVWNRVKQAFLRTEQTRILLRGSVGTLGVRVCSFGLRLLLAVVLARLLQVSGYGIYAYAVTWLGVLAIPTMLGLDQVLLRYVAAYKQTRSWPALKGLLHFSGTLALGAAAIVSLVSIAVVALFSRSDGEFRTTMWITIGLLPIVVLAQLRQASLRGLDRPVAAQIPENIVYPGLLILFAAGAFLLKGTTLKVPHVAMANAGAWVGAFLVGTVLLLRLVPGPVRASSWGHERSAWLAMIPSLLFSAGAYQVLSRADVLVLGALGSDRDVGLYAAATRGAEAMLFMCSAITLPGVPLFSSIYVTGDREELQQFTALTTRIIFWSSLPVYVLLMVLAPWVQRLFGPEFVEGAAVMRILLTTFFLSSLGGFVDPMLNMAGHQRDVAIVMGTSAAVNVGLSFLLIPSYGRLGAAIASGTSLMLLKSTLALVLYKRVGIVSFPFLPVRRKRQTYREAITS